MDDEIVKTFGFEYIYIYAYICHFLEERQRNNDEER